MVKTYCDCSRFRVSPVFPVLLLIARILPVFAVTIKYSRAPASSLDQLKLSVNTLFIEGSAVSLNIHQSSDAAACFFDWTAVSI